MMDDYYDEEGYGDYPDEGGYDDIGYGEEEGYGDYPDEGGYDDMGYGDEKDEFEEALAEQRDVSFAFRDIGTEGRTGQAVDIDADIEFKSEIERGQMRNIMQRQVFVSSDPMTQFKMRLETVIKDDARELALDAQDKSALARRASRLPMVAYKNPFAYVLGYYIRNIPQLKGIQEPLSDESLETLKIVEYLITNVPNITMFDVLKYARLWHDLALKQ